MYHIAVRQGWSQEFMTKYPHKDFKNKAPTESAFFGFGLKGVGSFILRKKLENIQLVQLFSHYQQQRHVATSVNINNISDKSLPLALFSPSSRALHMLLRQMISVPRLAYYRSLPLLPAITPFGASHYRHDDSDGHGA